MEKDYKKLYEDSLARMQRAFNTNRCTIGFMNEIFPETKESEEEKVRRFLVKWVNERMPVRPYDNDGFDKETVLAWLEKRGEKQHQKVIDDAYLKGISDAKKELEKQDKQKPIWSEEDSLMIDETIYFIDEFQKSDRCKNENDMQNSVTCKNWLKALKDRVGCEVNCTTTKEWSEEDIVAIDCAVEVLSKDLPSLAASIERLKSLRPQNPIDWTMQDEEELQIALDTLVKADQHSSAKWLKNVCLVPQNHWKPTEEQLKGLAYAMSAYNGAFTDIIKSLYNDLKKL